MISYYGEYITFAALSCGMFFSCIGGNFVAALWIFVAFLWFRDAVIAQQELSRQEGL